MKTNEFFFELPEHLIAQFPAESRGDDRMLVLRRHTGTTQHQQVADLPDILPADALLVFNDSKVRKARLFGHVPGASTQREFLVISAVETDGENWKPIPVGSGARQWRVMTRRARRIGVGVTIHLPGGLSATVQAHDSGHLIIATEQEIGEDYFQANGHVPLPPYIDRADAPDDEERYQTVYARSIGSIAAPTAGLHFTSELLSQIKDRGIEMCNVSLHVGLGTFLPVRTDELEEHLMHEEQYDVSTDAANRINAARAQGRPVIAVGTTAVRTLESAFDHSTGTVRAGQSSTNLYIYPGYTFNVIGGIFTNFHTPESTLLMLVSAFGGKPEVMAAYEEAVREEYRFYSYGDAMLLL